MAFDYDYIVIGSGFGGSVSALRLTQKGYRVAVVEMGKRYRLEDFAERNWQLRRFLWRPALGLHGIMQLTLLSKMFVLHGAGVGGGSLVYANTLLVPPARAFADPRWIGQDWQQALAPHYAEAQRMLGVVDAPQLYEADRLLESVVRDMGRADSFHRTRVGVFFGASPHETVPDPYFGGEGPPRTGCSQCGACMVGCRVGAKNTLVHNYLYFAEKGGARILAEQKVTGVTPREDGGYRVQLTRSTGLTHPRQELSAKGVVFAAGVLGTVPLLLSCRARGLLPRLSPQLGNYVRTNSETLLGVTAGRDAEYSKGIAISAGAYIDEHTHVEVCRYNEGSDAMSLLATVLTGGGPPWPRPLRWLGNVLAHPLQALSGCWPFGWAKRSAILLVMQPLDNCLRLVERRRWYWPFARKLVAEAAGGEPAPTYLPQANELARRMAAKVDGRAQSGTLEVMLGAATTAHILGGCPIGRTPAEGAVDVGFRLFGYDDLYVADASVIPANLGVNPSLTIAAMAEHAMSLVPAKR